MKVNLISSLLLFALIAGSCTKQPPGKVSLAYAANTTQIMPPAVAPPPPAPAAGNLEVTLNYQAAANGNPVLVTVYFIGPGAQTVTIPAGATTPQVIFTNQAPAPGQTQIPGNASRSCWVDAPANAARAINISATLGGAAFPNVRSGPQPAGAQINGFDATIFTDDGANQAAVVVQDGYKIQGP